jgi:hypothetical protein
MIFVKEYEDNAHRPARRCDHHGRIGRAASGSI